MEEIQGGPGLLPGLGGGGVRGIVRYLTWLQSVPFQQKLATALKIWICTLHSINTDV